jgi:hypothetical protein
MSTDTTTAGQSVASVRAVRLLQLMEITYAASCKEPVTFLDLKVKRHASYRDPRRRRINLTADSGLGGLGGVGRGAPKET